jgi:predicted unusual protein kinase regulating ubiquinone biosynthesis (AarF/ABC1/UbiB family)
LVWRSIRFFGARIDKIADPALRRQVARNALHVIATMVFEDGFFHADPHPGNIMIGPEDAPVIGLIDLGLVGRLSEDLRDGAIRLLIAAATGDAAALADALLALGKPLEEHRSGSVQQGEDPQRAVGDDQFENGDAASEQRVSFAEVVLNVQTGHHRGDPLARLV